MSRAMSRQLCSQLLRETVRASSLPAFLLPSFAHPKTHQSFSTSSPRGSKIGGAVLAVPSDVSLRFIDLPKSASPRKSRTADIPNTAIEVTGPMGTMTLTIPSFSTVQYDPDTRRASVAVKDTSEKRQRAMWGTVRQHLRNYILGVSEGHICILKLIGVGFRASVEPTAITVPTPAYPGQQFVSLKVGYAHPIELGVPEGVKATVPQPTTILLEGIDKEVVTQFAAEIRAWRKPEPYKGKGIFVNGETIRLKGKKIK